MLLSFKPIILSVIFFLSGTCTFLLAQLPKIRLAKGMPTGIVKENLGSNINSECSDLSPVISADGRVLYFGRYQNKGKCTTVEEPSAEHIWCSIRQTDGSWGTAYTLDFPFNNDGNNAVISISPDNNFIALMNLYKPDGTSNGGGLSFSTRQKGSKWYYPSNMLIRNFYNKNKYCTYYLSPDREIILMGIQRDDSFGDLDLYVSFREFEGIYSTPLNLGLVVNTRASEFAPYLSVDGKTLYFSSEGHPGYGNADIFVTRRLDNTWQHWSPPINLGNEINSSGFDAYFTITADGNEVYMVDGGDIVKLILPEVEEIRPTPVTLVHGKMKIPKGKDFYPTRVVYRNTSDGSDWGYTTINPDDGTFQIVLPKGDEYMFYAESDGGLFPIARRYNNKKITKYEERDEELEMIELPSVGKDSIVKPERLRFKSSGTSLPKDASIEVERIALYMKANPDMKVEIAGYTDNVGTVTGNINLSRIRAQIVASMLRAKGIKSDRILATGCGQANPIADNSSVEGKEKNRRVEFIFRKA